jgi:hypothetical protein
MALTTEQLLIAEVVGYEPFADDEAKLQFEPEVNYDPEYARFKNEVAKPGSIYRNQQGTYRYYWKPSGGNYTKEEKAELEGWYDIPCLEDLEEWTFDSVCFTPGEDEVEPDHPDSWIRLLYLI